MGMAGTRAWTATMSVLTICVGVVAGHAEPGLAGNPQPSETEADIELKAVTRQLE
jgi:hypothetical protein